MPLVMSTAEAVHDKVMAAILAGANRGDIRKPVTRQTFEATVTEVMRRLSRPRIGSRVPPGSVGVAPGWWRHDAGR